MKYFRYIK